MAFINNNGIAVSFDSDALIAELSADIAEFGSNENVIVWCKAYKGVTLYTNYDFIAAENAVKPEELEDGETLKIMTMGELLELLEQQNSVL